MKRTPYLLIIGEKEVNEGKISVRKQGDKDGDMGGMDVAEFVKYFNTLL
jgi:threonyl-tRNA synthetase